MLPVLHHVVAALLRRTWLVALATVIVCAAFAARGMAAFSVVEAATPPERGAVVAPPVAAPTPGHAKLDGAILVERNIFCSACVPRGEPGPAKGSRGYAGEPAVLIATSLGAAPRATIRVIASEVQGSWMIGERIPGVGTVSRIGGASIDVVDEAGHTGTLSLAEAKPATPAAATAAVAAPAGPFADRIEKLGDGKYRVDRQLIRDLVMGTTQAKGVRALPVLEKGEIKGLRLTGVRPDSVAAAVGIKSGDVLDAIDGVKIKSAQQLLDLFTRLDTVSAVELTGTRGGKNLALHFELR